MNERLEINGDLQDEYLAIQNAIEKGTERLLSEGPIIKLTAQDLEDWYQDWLAEQK